MTKAVSNPLKKGRQITLTSGGDDKSGIQSAQKRTFSGVELPCQENDKVCGSYECVLSVVGFRRGNDIRKGHSNCHSKQTKWLSGVVWDHILSAVSLM
jgi:hypothetical protein